MLIFYPKLHSIEKFLHGVVEDAEISSTPDNILVDDLSLIVEFAASFEEEAKEVLILIVDLITLLAAYVAGYNLASHSRLSLLLYPHLRPYCIAYHLRIPCFA